MLECQAAQKVIDSYFNKSLSERAAIGDTMDADLKQAALVIHNNRPAIRKQIADAVLEAPIGYLTTVFKTF